MYATLSAVLLMNRPIHETKRSTSNYVPHEMYNMYIVSYNGSREDQKHSAKLQCEK